jgi:hypothetical protein
MSTLPAPQYRVPIGTDAEGRPVMADRPFFEYLDRLFNRVGGVEAPTNSEISDSLALAIFEQRIPQPNNIRGGDGIDSAHDAAGVILSLDMGFVINAVRAYMPKQQQQQSVNDAQNVLAQQIFLPRI